MNSWWRGHTGSFILPAKRMENRADRQIDKNVCMGSGANSRAKDA
jgi:hypothetical protein